MKVKSSSNKSLRVRIILLVIGLGALYWILAPVVHVLVFQHGNITQLIFNPAPHEIMERLIPIGMLVIFSAYIQFAISKRKQAEERLQQSEENLRAYLESAPDGIYINDLKGTFLYGNKKAEEITGYKREELIGKSFLKLELLLGKHLAKAGKLLALNAMGKPTGPDEFEMIIKDGSHVWVEINTTPIKQQESTVVIGFVRDITEHKRAEEELRESERQLSQVVQGSLIPTFVINKEHTVMYWNKACEKLSGISASEVAGTKKQWLAFYPEERPTMADLVVDDLTEEELAKYYAGKCHKSALIDGAYEAEVFFPNLPEGGKWLALAAAPLRDKEGKTIGAIETLQDITERKRVEKELREAETELRHTIEVVPGIIAKANAHTGYFTHCNPFLTSILGFSAEEFLARPFIEFIHPDDRQSTIDTVEKQLKGSPVARFENRYICKDGAYKWLEWRATAADENGVIYAAATDITERKQAEKELRESEERLRTVVTNVPVVLFALDRDGIFTLSEGKGLDALGLKPGEVVGQSVFNAYKEVPEIVEACNRALAGETFTSIVEIGVSVFETWYSPIKDENGEVTSIIGVSTDLTERKQAEEKLRQSEKKYSTLVERGNDGIIIIQDGLLKFINSRMVEMTGFSLEEALGKPLASFVAPEYRELVLDRFKKRIAGEEIPSNYEIVILAKEGRKIPVEINASRIEYEGGFADMAIIHDITERKKMEEQLIVTDRLASIGELASGIAHELNNPLTSVIGFSDLLLDRDVPDDIKEYLSIINKEAKRTAGVVRNLLAFARKHPQERESVDINSIIKKVLELRAYEQKVNNIQVNTHFALDLPEIMANGFDLQQAFLNIIINAEHFMIESHGRGTLTITTERVGDVIRASFADDGPGIAKGNLGHLFDPFFTTKKVGKGTGLGLSICHGIVTAHDGRIYAESKLGKGATFVVELPLTTPDNEGTKNENS